MSRQWRCALMAAAVAAATLGAATQAHAGTKLLRFPDVAGGSVVFSYGGDLWKASVEGGAAVRLTAHPGIEIFAKFSPDGKWIAFTGQYDGDEQVYVMPAAGGVPKQLTFYPAVGPMQPRHGYDNLVYGWTPDGTRVVFRSMRDADSIGTQGRLYTVSLEGGLPVPLPMPASGAGDFSPDGTRMVYAPLFRDFRSWKRYQGGWAEDLYIYDLASNDVQRIAHTDFTERDPMWIGNDVYFASDRDGKLNLYRWDPAGGGTVTQLTHETTWDVRWPSSDNVGRIVYELGGELRLFDTVSGQTRALDITVPDDGLSMRPSRYAVERYVEDYALSPKGERAVFIARGDVFTVPIEKGPTRNLTDSSRSHEKHARWSPDGSKISFVSDMSGEEQVYVIDQAGTGKPEQLTKGFAAMLTAPEWSPDGTCLAFGDKDGKLYVLEVATTKVEQVADDEYGSIRDYAFSPDGAWLAFSMGNENRTNSLYVWGRADRTLHRVTDDMFAAYSPAWDQDGKYLYYLSEREFAPQISTVEWNFAGNRMTGIFALALRTDVANPFPPESDEVTVAGKDEKKDDTAEVKKEKDGKGKKGQTADEKPAPTSVGIDFDGLAGRVTRIPVDADNIDGLAAGKGVLIYAKSGAPFYGRESYEDAAIYAFDLKDRKESKIAGGVRGGALSSDGTKLLVRQGRRFTLYDAKANGAKEGKNVSTADLYVDRVPAQEWAEIYDEVWRRYRDFFYVKNMHGYDWKALGDQYRPWLAYVAHRSDLNYVLTELVSELSVGHAYIQGGDFEIPERPKVGLPGARFELDPAAGRYRLARILAGENQEPRYRSPLTEVGVDARAGDYVLAVDGVELGGSDNPYRLLRFKTDPVTLTLNSKPSFDGARTVTYRPIFDEHPLLYLDRVAANREKVAAMTGGRVGYIHVPDMGAEGAYEFIKWYYPQIRKEGLVVDVRANGGGNISQWIIERLDRTLLGTRFGYISDHPGTYPDAVFYGHMVCLISQNSASDGDIFPARFRKAKLGPLVGKRTWGGVVGISGRGPLLDGGQVFVPLNATNDVDGSYIIEGHGVDPDYDVDNDPKSIIEGRDPQLEKGVALVLDAMEKEPRKLPTRPPDPVKAPESMRPTSK